MAGAFRREPDVFNRPRPAAIEPVEKFSTPKPELNEAPVIDREAERVRFFLRVSAVERSWRKVEKFA
jgi:hypothetical protein